MCVCVCVCVCVCKKNVNSIEVNVCNNLWYLNGIFLKISQERRWVGVTCMLGKAEGGYVCNIFEIWRLGKNGETIFLFTLYREQKRGGNYPALNLEREMLPVGLRFHRWMPWTQRRLTQLMTLRKFRSVRNNNEAPQITFLHVQIGVFLC